MLEDGSPFTYCREKDEYKRRLAVVLVEMCLLSTVTSVVSTDLSCRPKNLGNFLLVSDHIHCSKEIHFEALV